VFRVASAQTLGPELTRLDIEAPDLARACLPGQFLMLRIAEGGERIPLTIADSDPERGSVSIIFLAVGKTTRQLSRLGEGDTILDVAGPLGQHMEIRRVGTVACVGGGVGVPALYPKARALEQAGNRVVSILGARTAEVSLNPIMVDGTGMCGGCRVTVGGETKFACVDGPVFDAHLVDFKELARRQTRFADLERRAMEGFEHACRLSQA